MLQIIDKHGISFTNKVKITMILIISTQIAFLDINQKFGHRLPYRIHLFE